MAACFIWGLLSFFLAYLTNTAALSFISMTLLLVLVAPILDEVLKSFSLVYYVRKPDFTYFVDGAIYGYVLGDQMVVGARIAAHSARVFPTTVTGRPRVLAGSAVGVCATSIRP